uniref:PHD domain-containing protein n=2 Tax=Rhodnius prolixus TaxID=13249 RepID=T1HTD6_RHOPR
MAKCSKCNIAVTRAANVSHAQCAKCKLIFHLECVGLTSEDWIMLKDLNKTWLCAVCSKDMRAARTDSTPASPVPSTVPSTSDVHTLKELLKAVQSNTSALNNFIESQKVQNADILKSLDTCHCSIKENTDTTNALQMKVDSLIARVEELSSEKRLLESRVSQLQMTVEVLKQASRDKTVEIHNIPFVQGENTGDLLDKIGIALDVDVGEVDFVYRAKPTPSTIDPPRPPPIIASFLRRSTCDNLVARRKVKRDFSTRHIGWDVQENHIIYINESLTPYFKKLYGAARAAKKLNIIKYVWVKNGRVLIRKTDGAPVISVCHSDDIPSQ